MTKKNDKKMEKKGKERKKILLLPGDGIGKEVVQELRRIIDWFCEHRGLNVYIKEHLVGGASYDEHKTPLTDEVLEEALASDVVFLGAVGGPQWEKVSHKVSHQASHQASHKAPRQTPQKAPHQTTHQASHQAPHQTPQKSPHQTSHQASHQAPHQTTHQTSHQASHQAPPQTPHQVPYHLRPEAALLRLRKELGLFANLRPAICFDALSSASSLKRDLVKGLDILIVRELTGGIYFGEPRGITDLGNGQRRGVNTQIYDTYEIERVVRVAASLAQKRKGQLVSVEKRNVMESGQLWHEVVCKLMKDEFPDVILSHMLADNCAMQLVRNPKQFDVLVTDNLFGDLLSDLAAQLTGSLGMLPSASLGGCKGKQYALYEPVHGSAPDIAGKGIANPLAMILSFSMALAYSFDRKDDARLLDDCVQNVLAKNMRTQDIMQDDMKLVSTQQMGSYMLDELNERM